MKVMPEDVAQRIRTNAELSCQMNTPIFQAAIVPTKEKCNCGDPNCARGDAVQVTIFNMNHHHLAGLVQKIITDHPEVLDIMFDGNASLEPTTAEDIQRRREMQ